MKATKEPLEAPQSTWLTRFNEFGERHSRTIVTISTALLLITVTAFAYGYWKRATLERANREVAGAATLEELKSLKEKYGATAALPKILFKLGNKYYEAGNLSEAKREFEEFKELCSSDSLHPYVSQAYSQLLRDIDFREKSEPQHLKEHTLTTHPVYRNPPPDERLKIGPVREPDPIVRLETPKGSFTIELYEDEAQNTVANFVKLCGENYFKDLKFSTITDEKVQIESKTTGAVDYVLNVESTSREGEEGALLMVKLPEGTGNSGAEFKILLKEDKSLIAGATIFGKVTEGLEHIRKLTREDAVTKSLVVSKRNHEYIPLTVKKP